MAVLNFAYEEEGYCRVYYKGPHGSLYCWQWEGGNVWQFYRCSKDGEPSYEVRAVEGQKATTVKPPPGQTKTGRDLIRFLSQVEDPVLGNLDGDNQ